MDPSLYYSNWWNNHNTGNNWYMDPHKSGALNQPPPAHNMSGPPQHPPPHGLPMGQPMAPRAPQPGYMPPRAHTGSVPMPLKSSTQPTPVLGQKQPHPGGSSSPKPPPAASTPPQDKAVMSGSPKPVSTATNVSAAAPIGTNKSAGIPSLLQSSSSKSLHTMSQQQQYHQISLIQQQSQLQQQQQQQQRQQNQHHMQQSVPGQQQINANQQQIPVNQHHIQQQPQQPSTTAQQNQQQQINPQQSTAVQHNQNLQSKPAAPIQNLITPKHEVGKGPTPPVPDLISIKQQPPASQPLPASTTAKLTFENKVSQSQPIIPKAFQSGANNTTNTSSVAASSKPVQNANSSGTAPQISGSAPQPSAKSIELQKTTPNVSIIPAKPASITQKLESTKQSDSPNTVTITPSVKVNENQEVTDPADSNAQNSTNMGPNQNGVSASKSTKSPATNISPKLAERNEAKSSSFPEKVVTPSSSAPVTVAQSAATKPAQPPTKWEVPKQSPTQLPNTSPKPPLVKPLHVSPPTDQTTAAAATTHPNQGLQKSLQGLSPQKSAISVTPPKTPTSIQPSKSPSVPLSPQTQTANKPVSPPSVSPQPKPAVTLSPAQSLPNKPVGSPVPKETTTTTNVSPTPPKKIITEKQVNKLDATKSEVKKNEIPVPQILKREVGRFPRSRKQPVEKETAAPPESKKEDPQLQQEEKSTAPQPTKAPPQKEQKKKRRKEPVSEEDEEVEEEEDEEEFEPTPKRRATRNKRKISNTPSEGERRSKRSRNPASVYQSPVPDSLTRLTKSLISTPKTPQEKLVIFFKNEHVALRNAEGTFYLCQIVQNVYKSTRKIKIRWLSPLEDKEECELYKPDYYDITDFDCILTSVALQKSDKRSIMRLPAEEKIRISNILQRAIDRDKGIPQEKSELNEDHPDGLDLSLYNDESQLKKRKRRSRGRPKNKGESSEETETETEEEEEDEEDDNEEEEEEKEEEEEEEEEPPPKLAKVSSQRSSRGPARTPAISARKNKNSSPAAPTPKASTPATAATPTAPPASLQTPSSRRGVRTFGSSRSVTRGARVSAAAAKNQQQISTPVAPGKDVDANKEKNEEETVQKSQRASRNVPKSNSATLAASTPTSKESSNAKEASSTPATKTPATRRAKK